MGNYLITMSRIDNINVRLACDNYHFRVVGKAPAVIGESANFVTRVFAGEIGVIYIDSNLERYLKHYGVFYRCTNSDLKGMKSHERDCLLLELAGELIF